jgi:hypothetical protein
MRAVAKEGLAQLHRMKGFMHPSDHLCEIIMKRWGKMLGTTKASTMTLVEALVRDRSPRSERAFLELIRNSRSGDATSANMSLITYLLTVSEQHMQHNETEGGGTLFVRSNSLVLQVAWYSFARLAVGQLKISKLRPEHTMSTAYRIGELCLQIWNSHKQDLKVRSVASFCLLSSYRGGGRRRRRPRLGHL